MEKLIVHGGQPLKGRVTISGSKNSALPILAATLLTKDTCTIRRVPDLSDTNYMVRILGELGAEVERASGVVVITANKIKSKAPASGFSPFGLDVNSVKILKTTSPELTQVSSAPSRKS